MIHGEPQESLRSAKRGADLCCVKRVPATKQTGRSAGKGHITSTATYLEVAVTILVDLPIFLPQDHHRHARTLQLASQRRPVRLGPTTLSGRDTGATKQPLLQNLVGDVVRQRPCQSGRRRPFQIVLDRRARHPQKTPHFACADPAVVKAQQMFAIVACSVPASQASPSPRRPFDGRGLPRLLIRGERTERAFNSSSGRLHFGMVAGIKSVPWPASNRNRWPDCVGIRRTGSEARPTAEDAEQFERAAVEGAEGLRTLQAQAEEQAASRGASTAPSPSDAASSGFRLLLPKLWRGCARRPAKPVRDVRPHRNPRRSNPT